jgi:dTDP-4-dehydrorhamnose 3,5-epimerase-like enzyme
MDQLRLLAGNLSVDDRGIVAFVNDFDFRGVKRFYTVANHQQGFIRAWHGHKHEAKYVTVVHGAALVAAVSVSDWSNPDSSAPVERFVLSGDKPSVLYIPPGYCNGFMSLTPDAKLMFFSTATLEESRGDDIRFPARFWNPWQIEER